MRSNKLDHQTGVVKWGPKKKKNKIKIMVYMIINIYRERLKKYTEWNIGELKKI